MGYEPFPVSAISGSGSGELLDALERQLPKKTIPEEASMEPVHIVLCLVLPCKA